jgi:hypothetical protein
VVIGQINSVAEQADPEISAIFFVLRVLRSGGLAQPAAMLQEVRIGGSEPGA